jgi:hypothetical protein
MEEDGNKFCAEQLEWISREAVCSCLIQGSPPDQAFTVPEREITRILNQPCPGRTRFNAGGALVVMVAVNICSLVGSSLSCRFHTGP